MHPTKINKTLARISDHCDIYIIKTNKNIASFLTNHVKT